MSSNDSLSLAGLDSPMVLQLDHPSSSSNLSSLTNRSCFTFFGTPPKVRAPILTLNHSPLSSSTVYNKACLPFQPLPPVPRVSSFQLSFILDATAQPSPHTSVKSLLPPPPSDHSQSSVGLSSQVAEIVPGSTCESYQAPEIHDPNNPYTPWPQSVRPLILPPPPPHMSISHLSHYSRPLSRSGAMAPEPFGSTTSVHEFGCRFPGSSKLRKMKQGVRFFSRRLLTLNMVLRKRRCARTSISPANLRPSSFLSIAFTVSSRASHNRWSRSRSSVMTFPRHSLTSWVEQRDQASVRYTISSSGHESMDIDEYERRGSWMLDQDEDCDIDECHMYARGTEHLEVGDGKYFGISLAAGQEALRRRRTNSNT